MFLMQWARCHWAEAQSCADTSAQPGRRRQSGSISSRYRYTYGWSIIDCTRLSRLASTQDDTLRFRQGTQEHAVCIVSGNKFYRVLTIPLRQRRNSIIGRDSGAKVAEILAGGGAP